MNRIYEIEVNKMYVSAKGRRFLVTNIAKHAQCCLRTMIVYVNVDSTKDSPPYTLWVLDEPLFLERFFEYEI